MNELTTISDESLPELVTRAAKALAQARTSAEVLDARDQANAAFHAAKQAGRMARAKEAHDDLLARVYRAQADALIIEATAKARLADEYDNHPDRATRGGDRKSEIKEDTPPPLITPDDVGGKDALKEARQIRNAELADPGVVERTASEMAEAGQEPTKAALREAIKEAVKLGHRGAASPKRKNPLYKNNPDNQLVIQFNGRCRQIGQADVDAVIAAEVPDFLNESLLKHARAAHSVLTKIIAAKGE